MGYVAVSAKDKQSGLRDVVFAWRGTIAPTEWVMDIQDRFTEYDEAVPDVLMAQGFRNMYMKSPPDFDAPQARTIHRHLAMSARLEASKPVEFHMYTRVQADFARVDVCDHTSMAFCSS